MRTLLAKAGLDESQLACGAHWPIGDRASRELSCVPARARPPIHNNCSGKHAGMLATAVHRGLDPRGYERLRAPRAERDQASHFRDLRRRVGSRMRSVSTAARCRPLPCRLPRWPPALPGSPAAEGLRPRAQRRRDGSWTLASPRQTSWQARAASTPSSCVGSRRLAFAKGGAEGVHCAALPALGIGIAVKVDDGTKRGRGDGACRSARQARRLGPNQVLAGQLAGEMRTWRGVKVGVVGPSPALKAAVRALPRQSAAARRSATLIG